MRSPATLPRRARARHGARDAPMAATSCANAAYRAVLYDSIVAQSRTEVFYRELGVPDTMEGRFELIVLHTYLVLERLRREGRCRPGSEPGFDRGIRCRYGCEHAGDWHRRPGRAAPRETCGGRAFRALARLRRSAAWKQSRLTPCRRLLREHIYGQDFANPNLASQLARYVHHASAEPRSAVLARSARWTACVSRYL